MSKVNAMSLFSEVSRIEESWFAARRRLRTPGVRGALWSLALVVAGWVAYEQVRAHELDRLALEAYDWARSETIARTALDIELGEVRPLGAATELSRTSRAEIESVLDLPRRDSLLAVSTGEMRERLESLPWVSEARVLIDLPQRIDVWIEEENPVALWREDGAAWLVNEKGAIFAAVAEDAIARDLPVLIGEDAYEFVGEVMNLRMIDAPVVRDAVVFRRVGGRRWNMMLLDGTIVMLPERDPYDVLGRLSDGGGLELLRQSGVSVLDLRLPDLIAVRIPGADLGRFPVSGRRESDPPEV